MLGPQPTSPCACRGPFVWPDGFARDPQVLQSEGDVPTRGLSDDSRHRVLDEQSETTDVNGEVVDYAIGDDSRAAGRRVRDLALPEGAVIALIARGREIIPPRGHTCISPGDHVILVLQSGMQPLVNQVFGRNARSLADSLVTHETRMAAGHNRGKPRADSQNACRRPKR